VFGRTHDRTNAHLGWAIVVATVPVVLAGFLLEDFVEIQLRSPAVIAIATAFFGVLLWVADLRRNSVDDEHKITLFMALLIGFAQVLALIPGTSRSGITITAGLGLGLSRETAARFSFLMSMPAIAGAATLETYELIQSPDPVAWSLMTMGMLSRRSAPMFVSNCS
jgi:undecaprenyl-diphosphatase